MHMILGEHSVAISAESIEHAAEQSPCTSTPGGCEVTIVGWDYRDHGEGQDVLFEVADSREARMFLRFGLSDLQLSTGQLARFIATVLQRELAQPKGMEPHFARQMFFNQAVGRRVMLAVVETSPADSSDP